MRLIGMVHVAPLPGSPRWEGSMERVVTAAVADARALIEGGMDAVLIENHGDAPFTPGRVEPATVAALAVVAREVRAALPGATLGIFVL
jgi:predicted TIM-barrel enzyme